MGIIRQTGPGNLGEKVSISGGLSDRFRKLPFLNLKVLAEAGTYPKYPLSRSLNSSELKLYS